MTNKQATGRQKDLMDALQLRVLQKLQTLQDIWRQQGMTEQALQQHSEQWIREQQTLVQ